MVRLASMESLALHPDAAPSSVSAACPAGWQAALAEAVRDPAELCRLLGLDPPAADDRRAAAELSLLVPRSYLGRIRPGDPTDPLLVQVLPQAAELVRPGRFQGDPLGEADAAIAPGLLSKYPGRSLIVTTGACAVHCRFCFRRYFPYHAVPKGLADFEPALRRIARQASIREVILSGGDPLALPDEHLAGLARRLSQIPHITRLRLHTRFPIVIPERVTDGLIYILRSIRLSPVMVVQVNHPAEIDAGVAAALGRLVDAGIPLLNQSVLLRGVNDRIEVLAGLCERLADLRVMPYYLHQLDRVAGAAHFEVPESTGIELIGQLRQRLPGYAVPRYVREKPGRAAKEVLA